VLCVGEEHAGVIYGLHTGDYDFRYIGKSIHPAKRLKQHIRDAEKGSPYAVSGWIRKHGAENIQMTVIETFTEDDLDQIDERERFHIAQARALYSANLNLTDGGDGQYGRKWSAEQKARMIALKTGTKHTDETKAKMSAAHKGKVVSPESVAKMKATRAASGYTHSTETRAKMSQAKAGKPGTRLGSIQSEETRAKISASKRKNPTPANHNRWHVTRNLVKPGCIFCTVNP